MQTIFVTWKAVELAQELYSMEVASMKALPRLIQVAEHPEVIECLEEMMEQSDCHLVRLEELFRMLNRKPSQVRLSDTNFRLVEAISGNLEMKMLAVIRSLVKSKVNTYGSLISLTHLIDKARATRSMELSLKDHYGWEERLTNLIFQLGQEVVAEMAE